MHSLTWLVEGRGQLLGHQSGDAGLAVGGLSRLFGCVRLGFGVGGPAENTSLAASIAAPTAAASEKPEHWFSGTPRSSWDP